MTQVHHGLEGVVAFETAIAEPDKEGSALRYRGVDIEDIVGRVPFENVWGLLIDGAYTPGLAPAEPYNLPVHTGDVRVDVQAAVAMLAPAFGFGQTYDISEEQARDDIGRLAVMVLSYAAQSARGLAQAVVPQKTVDQGATLAEKFLIRWKGEADPKHVKAIDAYWSSAAEHGMNASTFTARVITSTGADVAAAFSGAIGAMSGPLRHHRLVEAAGRLRGVGQHHHGQPADVFPCLLVSDVVGLSEPERRGQHRHGSLDVHAHVAGVHRQVVGLRGLQARRVGTVDEQAPDVLERHAADDVLDVDAAVAESRSFLVWLGDLGF